MGAFSTNIRVHTGGHPAATVREAVLASPRRRLEDEGFEVSTEAAAADRTILVRPAGPEP